MAVAKQEEGSAALGLNAPLPALNVSLATVLPGVSGDRFNQGN